MKSKIFMIDLTISIPPPLSQFWLLFFVKDSLQLPPSLILASSSNNSLLKLISLRCKPDPCLKPFQYSWALNRKFKLCEVTCTLFIPRIHFLLSLPASFLFLSLVILSDTYTPATVTMLLNTYTALTMAQMPSQALYIY